LFEYRLIFFIVLHFRYSCTYAPS